MAAPKYPIDFYVDGASSAPPKLLYHYSSWQGVASILESRSLRMRHSRHLNDKSEMQEGFELVQKVLQTTGALDNTEFGQRWERVRADWPSDFSNTNVYLTSFCEKSDTIDLWRAYVRNGGAAIGFAGPALRAEADKRGLWLLPCLYDRASRADRIFRLVEHFIHNYGSKTENDEVHFSDAVCSELMMEIPRQKSQHFASECEWRLFVHDNVIDINEPIEFSVSDRGIVPHLVFQFDPATISEIVVEPLATKEAILGLDDFLGVHGYEHVRIRQSEVPLRF